MRDTAQTYRAYWRALGHRDVYIPEALREPEPEPEPEITAWHEEPDGTWVAVGVGEDEFLLYRHPEA